jgi:hypothetical protein
MKKVVQSHKILLDIRVNLESYKIMQFHKSKNDYIFNNRIKDQ